ncbi:MAG: DUF393 domain-containing protein [Planctomycetota bacterium]|nr:DUF393 domain-containing protein [Planctomycetota bacterium]
MTKLENGPATWTVQVFFDGDCPLCAKEIAMIRWLDRGNRVWMVDISKPDFHAEDWGMTQPSLMAEIHGSLRGGKRIKGVEVFRRIYAAVGFSPLVWLTRIPGISHSLDWGYRHFAKNRLKWTGRCTDHCEVPKTNSKT